MTVSCVTRYYCHTCSLQIDKLAMQHIGLQAACTTIINGSAEY